MPPTKQKCYCLFLVVRNLQLSRSIIIRLGKIEAGPKVDSGSFRNCEIGLGCETRFLLSCLLLALRFKLSMPACTSFQRPVSTVGSSLRGVSRGALLHWVRCRSLRRLPAPGLAAGPLFPSERATLNTNGASSLALGVFLCRQFVVHGVA